MAHSGDSVQAQRALLEALLAEAGIADTAPRVERRERPARLPLSRSQELLWWIHHAAPETAAYTLRWVTRIRGPLDVDALRASLAGVSMRQEILRATFPQVDGEPTIVIDDRPMACDVVDLRALPRDAADAAVADRIRDAGIRPWQIASDRPRAEVYRIAADEAVLLVRSHHLYSDGWSQGVFFADLAAEYVARVEGSGPPRPALAVQYVDWVLAEREREQSAEYARSLAYWTERLRDAIPTIELPTDRARAGAGEQAGARETLVLPPELVDRIRALNRRVGGTTFMTLLASFNAVLARYTGQEDLAVLTPIANRDHTALSPVVGYFANSVVIRAQAHADAPFRDLLDQVRTAALEAQEHQGVAYARVLEALPGARASAVTPFSQVMFAMQNVPRSDRALAGLTLTAEQVDDAAVKFDLMLSCTEVDEGIRVAALYRPALFDGETIRAFLGHFRNVLEAVTRDESQIVARIPLMQADEEQRVRDLGRGPDAAVTERTLASMLRAQAARTPEAIALTCGAESLSYAALRTRVRALAVRLVALGVGRESRVGVCVERSIDMMVALLAVVDAGGAYVPLDPEYPRERLAYMLGDSGVQIVIASDATRDALPSFDGLVIGAAEGIDDPAATEPRIGDGNDLVYVIYTSGSTGHPKGVMVEQHSVVNYLEWMRARHPLGVGDSVLQKAPISFDASVWELFLPLVTGARLVLARPGGHQDAEYLAELLRHERISIVQFVPSQARMLLELPAFEEAASGLRRIFLGGEAAPSDVVSRLAAAVPHARITNLYGPTEATVYCSAWDAPPTPAADAVVPIGSPIAATRLYVASPGGALQPIGVPGELLVAGAGVARGYHARPDLTGAAFARDAVVGEARVYRTGDVARWRRDGVLEYLGRRDHQVKLRGFRIELGEIERTLVAHPGVRSAAVLAREDVAGDRRLVAYIVADSRGNASAAALRAHLRDSLPEYMVPTSFVELDALPLSANGKLDRRALPRPESAPTDDYVAPRTAEEIAIAKIWETVLRVERIGAHDDFFERGGHSLLAMRTLGRVEHELGVRVTFADFIAAPMVAELAARVAAARGGAGRPADFPPADASSGLPLSYQQELIWGVCSEAEASIAYNVSELTRVRGPLDVEALRDALDAVVARHDALRSRVVSDGAGVTVTVDAPRAVVCDVVDLHGVVDRADRESRALDTVRARAREAFDLTRDVLLRAMVVRVAGDEHLVLIDSHHFAVDGWSKALLLREIAALYAEATGGPAAGLAPHPVQYPAYAHRQRHRAEAPELREQLAYWRGALDGARGAVDLPVDRLRSAAPSFVGGRSVTTIPLDVTDGLRRLGARNGATLFMSTLAAFVALLHRYSGDDDIAVGSPIAGRDHPALDSSVGFFANTLPLRTRVDGAEAFDDLVRRVRDVCIGAFDHQEIPIERITEALDRGGIPLFNTLFVFQGDATATLALRGATVTREDLGRGTAKADLTMSCSDRPEGLRIAVEYRADLFDAETIERLLRHFAVLIDGAMAAPETTVARLPLLAPDERALVVDTWNDTAAAYPREVAVDARFREVARRTPDAIAATDGGRSVTYAELAVRAGALADVLRRLSLAADGCVAICANRSTAMLSAMLATLECGCGYLPLDSAYPVARLAFMLADADARIVVVEDECVDSIASLLAETRGVRAIVRLDRAGHVIAVEGVAGTAAPIPSAARELGGERAAYVMYTSGSTGQPKGVVVPHRAIMRLVCNTNYCQIGPDDVVLALAPTAFDASTLEIWGPLLNGGRVVLARDGFTDPGALADLVEREGVTTLWLTAALFQQVADSPELPRMRSLRYLLAGGDVLSVPHVRRVLAALHATRLIDGYGPTENTTFTCCYAVPASWPDDRPIPIGRPIANTRTYVLDAHGEPVPIGVPGELFAAGDGVALGYVNQPSLTAERFVPDPFASRADARMYRTGDRVRWRRDGSIEFLGRLDSQVKIRGFRVEPSEVEAVLAANEAIREVAVVVRASPVDHSLQLIAFYVASDQSVTGASLRAYLRERVPEHLVPSVFVPMAALPVGATGKVDRRALPAVMQAADSADGVPPSGDVEEAVARMWCALLHVESVSADRSFFDIGGHSLLAMRMLGWVQRELGVRVPLRAFFATPTVQGTARVVEAQRRAKGSGAGQEAAAVATNADADWAPLTPAQELLWLLERAAPGAAAYHVHEAVRVRGTLDTAALQAALDTLAERHEGLRCVVVEDGGLLRQQVVAASSVPLTRVSVDDGLSAEGERRAAAIIRDFVRAPFDLVSGPLVRACVVELAPDESIVVIAIHHIVTDGWSQGVLKRELTALYAAARMGQAADLPELPIRYLDAVRDQLARTAGARGESMLDHWRNVLSGDLRALELPGRMPGRGVFDFDGSTVSGVLSRDLVSRIDELARRHDVTRFMVLLAALQVVLHRYTGADDVLVGAPVAGRDDPRTAGVVAYLANTIVLRGHFGDDPTFADLLTRVRERCLDAYEHQDVPFERLAAALGRDAASAPLVQVLFALQNMEPGELHFQGATTTPMRAAVGAAKFDLTLSMTEHDGELVATLVYRAGAISPGAAARVLQHMSVLLEGAATDPELHVSALPLLSPGELAEMLAWNRTAVERPAPDTLVDTLAEQARRTPQSIAVEDGTTAVTFAALDVRANQLARVLQRRGVGNGSLVGICLDRSVAMIVAILAVLKAGAAYVPLDPEYPPERLALMVEDSALGVVLASEALRGRVGVLSVDMLTIESVWPELDREPSAAPPHGATAESLAYVIFTSGSTGRPKGVMIPHRAVVNFIAWARDTFPHDVSDAVLQKAPSSFDASVLELFLPLATGARLVLAPPDAHRDPDVLFDTLRHRRITTIQFVPSLLSALVDVPGFAVACAGIRTLVCGGEALPGELAQRLTRLLPDARLVNLYGPTETTVYSAIQDACTVPDLGAATVPIGRPIANTCIHVLDRRGMPVPRGVRGEIFIGGLGVAHGYVGRVELSAERFVPDRSAALPGAVRYRTGDLGVVDDAGVLHYLGRADDQVKLRGFRVELSEIESALITTGEVTHAAAVVREHAGIQRLLAYYVPRPGSQVPPAALLARLRDRLPAYMVPEVLTPLSGMPLSPSGKIDRRALPEPDQPLALSVFAPPVSALEKQLAGIWEDLLAVERVGVDDDFFARGGNSLLAIRLVSRIRQATGVALTIRAVFETSTLGALAARLSATLVSDADDAVVRALLSELSAMSDADAERMLQERTLDEQ